MWELLSRFSTIWNNKLSWITYPMALRVVLNGLTHRDWWNCRIRFFLFLIRNIFMTYNAADTLCQESGPIRNFQFFAASMHLSVSFAKRKPWNVACTIVQCTVIGWHGIIYRMNSARFCFLSWIFFFFFSPFIPFESRIKTRNGNWQNQTLNGWMQRQLVTIMYTFRVQFRNNGA